MTKRFIMRPTQWLVAPERDPSIYGEYALTVALDDEGGGEFVRITSASAGDTERSISFECEAWPSLQQAVNCAIHQINQYEHTGEADD